MEQAQRQIYVACSFPAVVEEKLAERYRVIRNSRTEPPSVERLITEAQGCNYLFISPTEPITRTVFEQLHGTLEAVATYSVGFNHVDIEAAREHGVAVFNSPGVLTDATADIGMLLLLNAARRGYEASKMLREGRWGAWEPTLLLGLELTGRRLGILGMGRIGQALAKRARGFGLKIHYHNRHRLTPDIENNAEYHATAEDLLAVSDIFAICTPSTPELTGFLNHERIAMLPPDAVVINIARGEMVVDDALIDALRTRRLFSAGLDVYRNEPALDPRYLTLENAFLTPHIGSATKETRDAMGLILLDALEAYEQGKVPSNRLV